MLDDELLWRRDGTSFYVEYASHPMVVGCAVVGSVVRIEDLSTKRQGRQRLAVQQQVREVLGGEAEVADAQKRVLAAIGSESGWDDWSMWLADASRADGAGAEPVASWPGAGASEDASGDGELVRMQAVQAIDLARSSVAGRHGQEAHRTFVAFPIRLRLRHARRDGVREPAPDRSRPRVGGGLRHAGPAGGPVPGAAARRGGVVQQ